jgi:hypothetical protein
LHPPPAPGSAGRGFTTKSFAPAWIASTTRLCCPHRAAHQHLRVRVEARDLAHRVDAAHVRHDDVPSSRGPVAAACTCRPACEPVSASPTISNPACCRMSPTIVRMKIASSQIRTVGATFPPHQQLECQITPVASTVRQSSAASTSAAGPSASRTIPITSPSAARAALHRFDRRLLGVGHHADAVHPYPRASAPPRLGRLSTPHLPRGARAASPGRRPSAPCPRRLSSPQHPTPATPAGA